MILLLPRLIYNVALGTIYKGFEMQVWFLATSKFWKKPGRIFGILNGNGYMLICWQESYVTDVLRHLYTRNKPFK